jgi:hypothetical protein
MFYTGDAIDAAVWSGERLLSVSCDSGIVVRVVLGRTGLGVTLSAALGRLRWRVRGRIEDRDASAL